MKPGYWITVGVVALAVIVFFEIASRVEPAQNIYQEFKGIPPEMQRNMYDLVNNISLGTRVGFKAGNTNAKIVNITFNASDSDVMVVHNLGRKPTFWTPVNIMYNATIWERQRLSRWNEKIAIFKTSYVAAAPGDTIDFNILIW